MDIDSEVEESLKRSRETLEESERLAAAAREVMEKTAAWRKSLSLSDGIEQRLFAMLPEEGRRKLRAEQEQFEIELKRDIETAAERIGNVDAGNVGRRKRPRNMA